MPVRRTKGARKVAQTMREFQRGILRTSAGKKVTSRAQALAIALRKAGLAKRRSRK